MTRTEAAGLLLVIAGLFLSVNRGLVDARGVDRDPLMGAGLIIAGVLVLMRQSGRRRGLRF